MKTTCDENLKTQGRLLEVAGAVFAEKGFRAATVREISRRAKTNVAAINYHFRDKKSLYIQAIRHWAEIAERRHPLDAGLGPEATAEDRFRAFVHAFMYRLLDEKRPSWHGKLMARELAEPTSALDMVVRNFYQPAVDRLCSIICELTGRGARDEVVSRCAFGVFGQCLYYRHARHVIGRLKMDGGVGRADVGELADHIAEFSLSALKAMSARKGKRRR